MTRRKAVADKKQVGRRALFSKRKEALLAKFEKCFLDQKDRKQRSAFYDKMGNWCIARWGYRADLSIDEDDEDADADEVINIEDSTLPEDDDLSEEEADLRTQYYNTLRTRLGQHFRRVVLHPPVKSGVLPLPPPLIATLVSANVPKAPVKSNFINQYMMMYYPTLMKGEADRRVAAAQFNYSALPLEERPKKEPCPLAIRKQVAKDFWETESSEVKADVLKQAGITHDENLEEWARLKEVPKTAAQYHHQIQYAGCTIRPILQALAAQLDAPMILLMPVPIPERAGDVEIVTVHVPKPGALVTDTWFAYDAEKYNESELSLLEWGRTQFSTEERARRALAPGGSALVAPAATTVPIIPATSTDPILTAPVPIIPPTSTDPILTAPVPTVPATSTSPLNTAPVPVPTVPATSTSLLLTAPVPIIPPTSTDPLSTAPVPTTPLNVLNRRSSHGCDGPSPVINDFSPPKESLSNDNPFDVSILTFAVPLPVKETATPLNGPLPIKETAAPLNIPAAPIVTQPVEHTPPPPVRSTPPPPPIRSPPSPVQSPPPPPPESPPQLPPPTLPSLPPLPLWSTGGRAAARATGASRARTPTPSPYQRGSSTAPSVSRLPAAFNTAGPSPFATPARSSTPSVSRLPAAFNAAAPSPFVTPVRSSVHPPTPFGTPHLGFIDLPDHIQLLHDYLLVNPDTGIARSSNAQWLITVREYVSFEKRSGFPVDSTRLAKPPVEIDWWRKSKRPLKDQPPRQRSAEACIANFWQWWTSLQPLERAYNPALSKNIRPSKEMNWEKLEKPGRNGVLLVMLLLTWWGSFSGYDTGWLRAVNDVTSVLRCLGATAPEDDLSPSSTPSNKRKATPLVDSAVTNKKPKGPAPKVASASKPRPRPRPRPRPHRPRQTTRT